jgi:rare lipoprotein A
MLGALLVAASGCAATGMPQAVPGPAVEVGEASFYGHEFHHRRTSSGEVYDQDQLTAAHPSLPFGTRVRVTNLGNGRSVVLRINDRGPFGGRRVIDVSHRAARELGFVRAGIARVRVQVVGG